MPPWPALPPDWTVMTPSFARLPATSATSAPALTAQHHCTRQPRSCPTRCCKKCPLCLLMPSKRTTVRLPWHGAAACSFMRPRVRQGSCNTATDRGQHLGHVQGTAGRCQRRQPSRRRRPHKPVQTPGCRGLGKSQHSFLQRQTDGLTEPASSVTASAVLKWYSSLYSCAPSPLLLSSGRPRSIQKSLSR
jgi:hypothetical protein